MRLRRLIFRLSEGKSKILKRYQTAIKDQWHPEVFKTKQKKILTVDAVSLITVETENNIDNEQQRGKAMFLPISTAAKKAGLARSTLYKMRDAGKISFTKSSAGALGVEFAELARVFPEVSKSAICSTIYS